MNFLFNLISFSILISVIVFVHELGHFLFARLNHVKVLSFSIGFGKAIFSKTDKHGTVWKIGIIPFGGYVSMLGQNDKPETAQQKQEARAKLTTKEKSESFEFKKRYQKIAIAFAGPLFNFLFSFIVFFFLFSIKGTLEKKITVTDIFPKSPAYTAGIKPNDIIVSINNIPVSKEYDIHDIIQKSNGDNLKFSIKRDNKNLNINLKPMPQADNIYFVGISYMLSLSSEYKKMSIAESLSKSYEVIYKIITGTTKSLNEMIVGKRSTKELGGIIAIANISSNALKSGLYMFLFLMATISVSLGFFNLLPIPVLDGGYIFIYTIESIIRRDISDKIKEKFFLIGFIIVISLMILSNFNDVRRLLK